MNVRRYATVIAFFVLAVILGYITFYDLAWAKQIHNTAPILTAIIWWIAYVIVLAAVILSRLFRRKAAKNR